MDKQYDHVMKDILGSYYKLGVVNRYDGYYFPSWERIHHVMLDIRQLLFPGYFGVESIDTDNLEDVTMSRVDTLKLELSKAIKDVFCWDFHSQKPDIVLPSFKKESDEITWDFLGMVPDLRLTLLEDATSIFEGDPAAKSITEVILSYPGFQSIMMYRVAHYFFVSGVPLIPRLITEIVHSQTGIDIHPGAKIGRHFCIDHGTGIVIGETAEIGDHVKLYQGVTLGGFSVKKEEAKRKRHPTLKDNVTVYARSTILGGDTVVGSHCTVGGNVWLTESLPDYSKVYLSSDTNYTFRQEKDNGT